MTNPVAESEAREILSDFDGWPMEASVPPETVSVGLLFRLVERIDDLKAAPAASSGVGRIDDLVVKLKEIEADHLRLASWNTTKDRPARVAFHHDAVQTLRRILARLHTEEATKAARTDAQGAGE